MALREFLLPWDSQPQEVVGVDWGNPKNANIAACLPLGVDNRDIVSGRLLTFGSGGSITTDQRGKSLLGSGSASVASVPIDLSAYNKLTVSFWLYWNAYAADDDFAMEFTANTNSNDGGWSIDPNSAGSVVTVYTRYTGGANGNAATFTRPSAAAWHHYQVSIQRLNTIGANGIQVWIDGVSQTVTPTLQNCVGGTNFPNSTLYLLSRGGTTLFGAGRLQNIVLRGGYLGSTDDALYEYLNPWSLYAPRSIWVPVSAGGGTATLAGTVTTATEADIVAGGETVILTLTGDIWVASGGTFDAIRQDIIDGLDSAQSELLGWDNVVKGLQGVSGVVRTSDTVVTITLDAQATYSITADETITATIPASAVTGGVAIVAAPTFDVTEGAGVTFNPAWARNCNTLLMGGRL